MTLGPITFDAPLWLVLLPIALAFTLLVGRRTLSGMAGASRKVSLAVRLLLMALLVAILAEPSWRKTADSLALVVIADASRSMPVGADEAIFETIEKSANGADQKDRIGLLTVAKEAEAQVLPDVREEPAVTLKSNPAARPGQWRVSSKEATNLASGIQLAIAAKPEDAAGRIVLASDGNETDGSVLAAAATAKALGIPIDVLPVPYTWDREVIFEALAAPSAARQGQTITLRMVLNAMRATRGRLTLVEDGVPVDITPDEEGVSLVVDLEKGANVITRQLDARGDRPHIYKAVFEPLDAADDAVLENNSAMAVTFVSGEGRVLVYSDDPRESEDLVRALIEAKLDVEVRDPAGASDTLLDMQPFDAILLVDVPSDLFSVRQQEELAAYVHDTGGGLLMVGGPDSFGAGGWIGTPVAEVLPLKLDPPPERKIPMGALALIIDRSGSMAMPVAGTSMDQLQLANEASILGIQTLSRLDQVTVIAFAGDTQVIVPLTKCENAAAIARAVRSIVPGGGTNMFPALDAAAAELAKSPAGVKHIIALTDGQTMGDPNDGLSKVAALHRNGITFSMVAVGDDANSELLKGLAVAGNGRYYAVRSDSVRAVLPQIFIKEAQTVKRSLIWEGDPVLPTIVNSAAEPLRGIPGLPAVTGYVVTGDREGLALVTARGPENDPIIAQWQHGLGRAVAFTSDSTSRWASAWVGWGQYRAFWDQHVRWAMRPTGSSNLTVATQTEGERTKVVVSALDEEGNPLDFASFTGRALGPDLQPLDVPLRQTGPGRYEGSFTSAEAGAYTLSVQYEAAGRDGADGERGSSQAAVTRPYADEHRALKDNTPLLRQVAEMTGGRVLEPSRDGSIEDLFSREGVKVPVALTPIWFALALGAIALFLTDVAVRRVRIDVLAIARSFAGLFRRGGRQTGQAMGSLRQARERAQSSLARQSRVETSGTGGTEGASSGASGAASGGASGGAQASRKFEADERSIRRTATGSPLSQAPRTDGTGDAGPQPAVDSAQAAAKPRGKAEPEQGMSRLLSAKKRAREAMGDEADARQGGE